MCTIIILPAYATRGEEKLERENRDDAHQTEKEKRGMKQVLYNMFQTATSDSDIHEWVLQYYVWWA